MSKQDRDKAIASVQRAFKKVEKTGAAFREHGKNSEGSLIEAYETYQKARTSLSKAIAKADAAS